MSREIKRVALGFDWPLNKVWEGFQPPDVGPAECGACGGTGLNPAARAVADAWYDLGGTYVPDPLNPRRQWNPSAWSHHLTQDEVDALCDQGRLVDFTKTYVQGQGWVEKDPPYRPTADEVNRWSRGLVVTLPDGSEVFPGHGHDAINRWIAVEARLARLGFGRAGKPRKCQTCDGRGRERWDRAALLVMNRWKESPPPAGPGWQLWESVSEGSPISPVFATSDGLVGWMEAQGYSRAGALGLVKHGSTPGSFGQVVRDGQVKMMDGVDMTAEGVVERDIPVPPIPDDRPAALPLGQGILNWPPSERRSDRYSLVTLDEGDDPLAPTGNVRLHARAEAVGQGHGWLVAEVVATRDSAHVGDVMRGLAPETPEVGERLLLGYGRLFTEDTDYGSEGVGVRPDDRRRHDWLRPQALYRCHSQTVRLGFVVDVAVPVAVGG